MILLKMLWAFVKFWALPIGALLLLIVVLGQCAKPSTEWATDEEFMDDQRSSRSRY